MEMSLKEMGLYLKKLRENKGLSTREVYELAKASNSYLSLCRKWTPQSQCSSFEKN